MSSTSRVCTVPDCGRDDTDRYLTGWRCDAHSPGALAGHVNPTPVPFMPSGRRVTPDYGDATSDPLGRDGPGWHIGKTTRLPTRDKKPPAAPSPWALKKRS